MTGERSPEGLVRDLVAAFAAVDPEAMGAVLADDVVAHITNAAGGSDVISGRDELVSRLGAFDYGSAELSLTVTNAVEPAADQAMVMVEVRATRSDGAKLHNHAAHLCTVRDGLISEWWMVDALPARSDEFWRGA